MPEYTPVQKQEITYVVQDADLFINIFGTEKYDRSTLRDSNGQPLTLEQTVGRVGTNIGKLFGMDIMCKEPAIMDLINNLKKYYDVSEVRERAEVIFSSFPILRPSELQIPVQEREQAYKVA